LGNKEYKVYKYKRKIRKKYKRRIKGTYIKAKENKNICKKDKIFINYNLFSFKNIIEFK